MGQRHTQPEEEEEEPRTASQSAAQFDEPTPTAKPPRPPPMQPPTMQPPPRRANNGLIAAAMTPAINPSCTPAVARRWAQQTPTISSPTIEPYYRLGTALGSGAYSTVREGRCTRTEAVRAVKVVDKTRLNQRDMDVIIREKEVLRRVRHANIIHLHDVVETDTHLYMALDKMSADLFDFIVAAKKLSEADAASVVGQLLEAVKYLHDADIVHRDIKPENILLNSVHEVKLADFGLAKVINQNRVDMTPCGSGFYIAPEIVRGIQECGGRVLCSSKPEVKSVDMWAVGCVLYITLCGKPPFRGGMKSSAERKKLLQQVERGVMFPSPLWDTVGEDAKDLVLKLLSTNSVHRITAAQALDHPFFTRQQSSDQLSSPDFLRQTKKADLLNEMQPWRDEQQLLVENEEAKDEGVAVPVAAWKPPPVVVMNPFPAAHKHHSPSSPAGPPGKAFVTGPVSSSPPRRTGLPAASS